jgi:hypothetical protein
MITKHSCKSKKWIVQTNCPIEEGTDNQEKYLEAGKRTSEDIESFLLEGASYSNIIIPDDKNTRSFLFDFTILLIGLL